MKIINFICLMLLSVIIIIVMEHNRPKRIEYNCVGTCLIVPVNPSEKGYKANWYKLQKGECSVSLELRNAGILMLNDRVLIENEVYTVKSYSKVKGRVIEIWSDLADAKEGGARRIRCWANYSTTIKK